MSGSRVTLQLSAPLQEMKLVQGEDLKLQIDDRIVLEGSNQITVMGRFERIMDLYNTFVGKVNVSWVVAKQQDSDLKESHSINLESKGALSQLRQVSDLMRLTFYDYVSANQEHLVHINNDIYKDELREELLNSLIELENIVKDIDSSQKLVSKEKIRSILYYVLFLIMRLFGRVSPEDYHNKHYNYSAYRLRQNEKDFFLITAKILGLEDPFSSMDSDVFSGLYIPLDSFGVNFSSRLEVKQPKSFVEISADRKKLDEELHALHYKIIEVKKSGLRSEIQERNNELKILEKSLKDKKTEIQARATKLARAKNLLEEKEKRFKQECELFTIGKRTLSSLLKLYNIDDVSYFDEMEKLKGKYKLVEEELIKLETIKSETESRIEELEKGAKEILGDQKLIDEQYLFMKDKDEELRKEYESLKRKISGIKGRLKFAIDKLVEQTRSKENLEENYEEIIRNQLVNEGWKEKQITSEKIETTKNAYLKTYNANIKIAEERIQTESEQYDYKEEERMCELEKQLEVSTPSLMQLEKKYQEILAKKDQKAQSDVESLSKKTLLTEIKESISKLYIRKDVIERAIQCNRLKVNIEKLIKEKREAEVALKEASQVSEYKLLEEESDLTNRIKIKKMYIRSKESELLNASSVRVSDVFEKDFNIFPIRGLPFRSIDGKMIRSV